jgi:hypothetical protein
VRGSWFESRQEVTTVLTIHNQRPSALLAVCAPVSELPWFAAAPIAHDQVGYGAVVATAVDGTMLTQPERLLARPRTVQGTSVFTAKQSVIDMDPVGGVRGKPPRGRPV